MTINVKNIGKWLAVLGAIASAVIGAVGTGTLPNPVRVALVAIGAVVVAVERVLSTTVTVTTKTVATPAPPATPPPVPPPG